MDMLALFRKAARRNTQRRISEPDTGRYTSRGRRITTMSYADFISQPTIPSSTIQGSSGKLATMLDIDILP